MRDASNFLLSGRCRNDCLRHTVTVTQVFESTSTEGKEQKLCQSLNILKQAPRCESKRVIQHKMQHVLSGRFREEFFFLCADKNIFII